MEFSSHVLLIHLPIIFVIVSLSLAAVMHAGMVVPSVAAAALCILLTRAWLVSVAGERAVSEGRLAASLATLIVAEAVGLSLPPRSLLPPLRHRCLSRA